MLVVAPEGGEQAIELMVADHDAPLIAIGRHARIQFSGWPAIQMAGWPSAALGTFAGRVAAVDASNDGFGFFRLMISPDAELVKSGKEVAWPPSSALRAGTQASAWILLDRVPLWFELWRRLNGFPPSTKSSATSKTLEKN